MKNEKDIRIEAAVEAMRASAAQVQTLVDAYAAMGHAAADVMRSVAARVSQPASQELKAPPPVSMHLRRFVNALAEKAIATIALLTDDQRTRLGALVPAFTSAALANEPDVVEMVAGWLDLPPESLARDLVANLDALEQRFAS